MAQQIVAKISCPLILMLLICGEAMSRVSGRIITQDGVPIPFVSIYIHGTTTGTSSNELGKFELHTGKGNFDLVFQQIGFEKQIRNIVVDTGLINFEVIMFPASYQLNELEFTASREDPAYAIIRKAIVRKKELNKIRNAYTRKAYTKGVLKVLRAPKEVLGQKIGNLGGMLDSAGRGILYLSEAESILASDVRGHLTETMISSKVAGNDRGFSFNRASSLSFDLNQNSSEFGRSIVSPLADYTFNHYRFKLMGEFEQEHMVIYKIFIEPLYSEDACWHGFLYINGSDYSLYEFDGFILGAQCKQEIFDTIRIKQQYTIQPSVFPAGIRNQVFRFNAVFFGFKVEGSFTVDLSEYHLTDGKDVSRRRESLVIEDSSNLKSTEYWLKARPVPLLTEEALHYSKRDSAKVVRDSRRFKDSMDRKNNRFGYGNLILGYAYNQTYRRSSFSFQSPVNSIQFNPVQGLAVGTLMRYSKSWRERLSLQSLVLSFNIEYGISNRKWLPGLGFRYNYNPVKNSVFSFHIGSDFHEFNNKVETNTMYNQYNCLWLKKNALKLYQSDEISASFATDINYDLRFESKVYAAHRYNQTNHSDYSFRYKNKLYESNSDFNGSSEKLLISQKDAVIFRIGLYYTPMTEVWKTPEGIDKTGSRWPEFYLRNQFCFYGSQSGVSWSTILKATYQLSLSSWGDLKISGELQKYFYGVPDLPEAIYAQTNPFSVEDLTGIIGFRALKNYVYRI